MEMADSLPLLPCEEFYYDDPAAPDANVPIHPGVSAVIFDERGRILFMKRTRGDYWCLPGGRIDMDESAQECCIRETFEETGLLTRIVRLVSVNSHPRSIVSYPDGRIHRSFTLCYEAEIVGGTLRESAESEGFRWCSPEEVLELRLIPDSRLNVEDALRRQQGTVLR